MPGFIVHLGAIVQCVHGGRAQPTSHSARVTVGGQPVATMGPPWIVSGCALPPPPAAPGPCVTATWLTASTRVRVGGQPVLVQDGQAVCAPSGTPLLVLFTQTRVSAR
ncbi:MAG: hypothetical protein QOJ69_1216 [Actinomycetota bacterium]|nr:hypothetical protein [Actinomycetota bacterium]